VKRAMSDLQQRFRGQIVVARREYLRFSALFGVFSLALLACLGLCIAIVFLFFGLPRKPVPIMTATVAVMAVFLAIGYWISRKRRATGGIVERLARASAESLTFKQGRRRMGDFMAWGPDFVGVTYLLVPFVFMASVPYFFLREFISGRHLFASDHVKALAFKILTELEDRVEEAKLEKQFREGSQTVQGAMRLLVEMGFFLVTGTDGDAYFIRTTEGRAFVKRSILRPVPWSSRTEREGN
jgi:hypothetical protein